MSELKQVAIVMIFNAEGRVLLVKRSPNDKGKSYPYEFLGGNQDPNETLYEAAFREVEEETGLTDVTIYSEPFLQKQFDDALCNYYVATTTCDEPEVVLNSDNHVAYIWVNSAVEVPYDKVHDSKFRKSLQKEIDLAKQALGW